MRVTVRFGVEEGIRGKLMIVLLPWKTLGLIGLGPKARTTARAQNLPACTAVPMRTREAACALGSCCGENSPWANSHCVQIMETFLVSLPKASHTFHQCQDNQPAPDAV